MIEQIELGKMYYLPVRVTKFDHETCDEEPTVRLESLSGRHRLVDFGKNIMNELVEIDLRIDQPKLEVPQFVAEWIEKYKKKGCRLSHALEHVFDDVELGLYIKQQEDDYTEIIAKAWIYGYTVKKEKLYTVEIPTNSEAKLALIRRADRKVVITIPGGGEGWRRSDSFQLTEQEIRKDFDWAWQWKTEVAEL